MKNTYLFIIWNKALFCKDRIMNDLSKDFEIINSFYMEIPKENFKESLLAFYGTKASNLDEKIFAIGNGKFYVIIVKDINPSFEKRKTYNGLELVNSKIYDKKWLYRKWTAGSFRIHSSQSENETIHDLSILLSSRFRSFIHFVKNNQLIKKDSLVNTNYDSIKDFSDCINNISASTVSLQGSDFVILARNKTDILYYLNNKTNAIIDNKEYSLYIFGVDENEIDRVILEDNEMIQAFYKIYRDYHNYLKTSVKSESLINYSRDYGFDLGRKIVNTTRQSNTFTLKNRIVMVIKYSIKRIHYVMNISD